MRTVQRTPASPARRGGRPRRARQGVSLMYGLILAMLGLTFCTLAVDYGHVQIVKSELQRCADDTARGTVQAYLKYGAGPAQASAPTLATANPVDAGFGTSPTVRVTWGYWNPASGFVAGTGTPVAVQVDASRKAVTGNAIPLLFPVFSNNQAAHPSCDVGATAVAIVRTQQLIDYSAGFTATSPLTINGDALLSGTHLRLTTNGSYGHTGTGQASSAWHMTKVPVGAFNTAFSFQITHPTADGCCFAIQNASATAVGGNGSSLGYAGIANSVAVKFDIYDTSGEGPNSTGCFSGGAMPSVPATNLTPTSVDLHSGHVMNVAANYDGTTLAWTITDASTAATASVSAAVNIPVLVGGAKAYVGFTGGTGGSTSTADILNWTYSVSGPQLRK